MRERAEEILRRLAGPDARLREDQWRAISALVEEKRRVLCVQRTGWGKSAVYFVATALLRASGAGPTVIVSPLLALMRNQVEAAARAGIRAHTINSANLDEWDAIHADIAAGSVDVLLISPERLNNPDFRDNVLPKLASTTGLLVVDEAHCVSDWGHDFRPDYRRLRTFLASLSPETPVLATTATANQRVTDDVAEQLGDALVLRGSLERDSLRLAVLDLPSPARRLAWLADHLDALPGSGIVYTLTVAAAAETAEFLRQRGYPVAAYSGQSDDAERRQAEQDLLDNKIKALVATSALGMGFDKPDLGFVVHLGAPPSPIAYYQQVGRAGRAVRSAEVLLLPGPEDAAIWRYFASLAFPPEDQVRAVLHALDAAGRPLSTQALEPIVDLRRTRLEMMLKVLDVDGAVRRVRGGWVATGEPWAYDTARLRRVAAARTEEQQTMREYVTTQACRMEFLRRCLDDPGAAPCGRCDNCARAALRGPEAAAVGAVRGGPDEAAAAVGAARGGPKGAAVVGAAAAPEASAALHGPEVSGAALAAAEAFLGRAGVEIAPKKLWPTGLEMVRGKIGPDEQSLPGRAVGRLSDLGWGGRLRDLLGPDAVDAPLPADVTSAVVEVLKDWSHGSDPWERRPVAVVGIASRRRPVLVESLASRIAEIGRLRLLGLVSQGPSAPPSGGGARGNSAQRVRALHDAFELPPDLAAALSGVDGPVLLVDDLVDSGWTMTIAARLLRQAGAPAVLPLALAVAA